jgi:hypothetical protein
MDELADYATVHRLLFKEHRTFACPPFSIPSPRGHPVFSPRRGEKNDTQQSTMLPQAKSL